MGVRQYAEVRLRYYKNLIMGGLWPELDLITRLAIHTGRETIIDIGANVGLYTYHFSKKVRYVHAFEPLEKCAKQIINANLRNVTVHPVALSNTSGRQKLMVPMSGGRELTALAHFGATDCNENIVEVDVRKLDDFSFMSVGLIKIDVEGHEWAVIEGGLGLLRNERPILHIEIEQRHLRNEDTVASVVRRIQALGYRGYMLILGRPVAAEAFRYEVHQEPYIESITKYQWVQGYVNNFLFLPN